MKIEEDYIQFINFDFVSGCQKSKASILVEFPVCMNIQRKLIVLSSSSTSYFFAEHKSEANVFHCLMLFFAVFLAAVYVTPMSCSSGKREVDL